MGGPGLGRGRDTLRVDYEMNNLIHLFAWVGWCCCVPSLRLSLNDLHPNKAGGGEREREEREGKSDK
jgi:hypothetical protein